MENRELSGFQGVELRLLLPFHGFLPGESCFPEGSETENHTNSTGQANTGRIGRCAAGGWHTRGMPMGQAFAEGTVVQDLRSGMCDIARSARAVMVSDGLTPGFADTADPSMTYSPS